MKCPLLNRKTGGCIHRNRKNTALPLWRQGDWETLRAVMVEEKVFGCCGKVKICDHVSVLNIDGIYVKIRLIIIIMCSLLIICTVNTR